jgi:hypothetical protein
MPVQRRPGARPAAAALACLALAAAPAAAQPRNLSDVPRPQRLALWVEVTEEMRRREAPAIVSFTVSQPAAVQVSVYDREKTLAFSGKVEKAGPGRPVRARIGQWSSTRAAGPHLLVFRVTEGGPDKLPRLAFRQMALLGAEEKDMTRIARMGVDPGAGSTGGKFTVSYKLGLASKVSCQYVNAEDDSAKPTLICDEGERAAGAERKCDWTAPPDEGTYIVQVMAGPITGGGTPEVQGQPVPIKK